MGWDERWQLDITPWTLDHDDPARRMVFYLGIGHPNHLNHTPVPVCLAATTLARYRSRGEAFPVRGIAGPWMGDSGAYSAQMLTANPEGHPWELEPDEYGAMWVRLIDDIGQPPQFVAVQDWPCEAQVIARNGGTIAQRQLWTLESYLYLQENFPMVPWLPILQGDEPWQYVAHHDAYIRAGVQLAGRPVGIGSVCRRGSQHDIARVLGTLAPLGMLMHGFGVSINGLRLAGHLLASSDTQAWSVTAKLEGIRLPGCTHMSRPGPAGVCTPTDCRNCFRYALAYREEVLAALRAGPTGDAAPGQLDLLDLLG